MTQFRWFPLATTFLGLSLIAASASAQSEQLNSRIAAGEFAAGLQAANDLPAPQRNGILAQIAGAQANTGEPVAAGSTLRGISSPSQRADTIDSVRGAGGGAGFADFDSLMQLIQTTVAPDTWEALGGPSTMAPYPQGIYVDSAGTVRTCETFSQADAVADLKSLLAVESNFDRGTNVQDWRGPTKLRCVSLRRLQDQWAADRSMGVPQSDAMIHLAGLSRVQYLFFDADDIVIAGPVGGIDQLQGWYRDHQSGRSVLRTDFFTTCLASAIGRQPFGCTIDPTTEGLQKAVSVAAKVQSDAVPIGKASTAMAEALGMQRVEVFGTAGDTPIGYLMVEADRHMKELALGKHPMPRVAKNYLDVIDETIAHGPPSDLLLRLWFTTSAVSVRADKERQVFEIDGTPIRLSGQNERAMASGARGNITVDFRSEMFVKDFNQHWTEIRSKYPLYGALESVYQSASIAELLQRFGVSAEHRSLIASLADMDATSDYLMPSPRQVPSIATMHSVRHGRQVHHVVLASGGVSVDSRQTLTAKISDYPSLKSLSWTPRSRPSVIGRWWWNASE